MKPFRVVRPEHAIETPLVVEVPHAGVYVDPESLAFMCAPLRAVGRDADLYVDELFEHAPSLGATLLTTDFSRYVLDLNRARTDFDGHSVLGGPSTNVPRGLVWRATTDGEPILARRLPAEELERRCAMLYGPYHRALEQELDAKKARFGYAILLCAHSMPSTGRRGHVDVGAGRADVVPGSRGRTTAAGLVIDRLDAVARAHDYSVRHDDPYKGGFSTGEYGQPHRGWHAVQVELARRIYMDEDALCRLPAGFARAKAFGEALVAELGTVDPRPDRA